MRRLLLLSSLVSFTFASYCGQAAVPFTFQVLRSGLPVLGCARPRCFGWNANGTRAGDTAQFYRINGKEDGYLRRSDQTKRAPYQNPEYEAQTSFCQPDYISASCSKNEWVGGIQPQAEASPGMKLRCCSYDPLTVSEDRGVANVTKGQLVVGGEVFQAKTLVGFDYISNVERYILEDGTVRYSVSVRRMDCIDDDSLYGGAAPIDTEVVAAQTTEEARTVPPTPAPTAPPPTRPRTVQTPPPETPAPETGGPVAPPREFAAPSEAYEQRAPLASYTGFGSAPGHEQHQAAPPGYQSQTTSPQHHNEFQPQSNNQQNQQSNQNQYNGQQHQYSNQPVSNNQQQYGNNQQNYGNNQQNYGSNQQGYGNNKQGYSNQQQGYGNQQQPQQNHQQSQQNQPQQPQQPLDAVLNLLGLPALPTLIPPAPQQPVTPSPFNMPPGMQQQSSQQYQQPQQGQYQQQQGQRFQNQQQYPQQVQQNQGQYNQNQQDQPQYSQNQLNQQQFGQNQLNQQQFGQNQPQYGQNQQNQPQYSSNQQNQPQYSSNQQNQPQYSSNQQPQQYQGPIVQNHIVQGVQQLNPPLQPLAPAPQGQFYSPIPQQNQQNQLQPLPTLPPLKLPTLDDLPKVEIPDVDDVEAVIPPMPRLILNQVAKFFGVL